MDIKKLTAPFNPEQIRWRVGATNKRKMQKVNGNNAVATKGIALCYVNARDVEDRLDEVVGADKWETHLRHSDKTCVCELTINGVTKSNGSGETDIEGEKGAMSKALVRAGSSWGIGRYLYNAENIWVNLDKFGKIEKSEQSKLDKMHARISKGELIRGETPADPEKAPEPIKKALTEDEKFELVRQAILKRKTVEQIDEYFGKMKASIESMTKENQKLIDGMIEQRKNEILGDVG